MSDEMTTDKGKPAVFTGVPSDSETEIKSETEIEEEI